MAIPVVWRSVDAWKIYYVIFDIDFKHISLHSVSPWKLLFVNALVMNMTQPTIPLLYYKHTMYTYRYTKNWGIYPRYPSYNYAITGKRCRPFHLQHTQYLIFIALIWSDPIYIMKIICTSPCSKLVCTFDRMEDSFLFDIQIYVDIDFLYSTIVFQFVLSLFSSLK